MKLAPKLCLFLKYPLPASGTFTRLPNWANKPLQTVSEKNIQWDFHPQEKIEVQFKVKFVFILKAIQFATKGNLFPMLLTRS